MKVISKINEKGRKLFQYIRLRILFSEDSEFRRVHPEEVCMWEKKFRQMIRYSSDRTFPIVEEFVSVKIDKMCEREQVFESESAPILICVLKNDIEKIRFFMEHYRKRGINHFVFLDNMSTDGTFEYLQEQKDADIYQCGHSFTADRKIAWVNRLIAEYGINKWYLMVDSDEFFTYLGEDRFQFRDVIQKAEEEGFKRLGVVHLDMYPKGSLFRTDSRENFIQDYCYFDKNTYVYAESPRGMRIAGGPRKRVFGTDMKVSGYRLVYFEEDDIVPSAHFMIPYEKSYGTPVSLISLHYKFVNESDYEKMIEAVETGMHSDNSAEYKTYYCVLKENPQISLYDEEHSEVLSEENLRKISFIKDIFSM